MVVAAQPQVVRAVANGQYLSRGADGLTLAATAPDSSTAETFDNWYRGDAYVLFRTSTGDYVSPVLLAGALPAAAGSFTVSAPRSGDGAVTIRVSTGGFWQLDPATATLTTGSSPDWFVFEPGPNSTAPATVTVDLSDARQTVQGFGGAIAYYSGWLTAHPNKKEIYAALFDPATGLGMSMLRWQNNFRYQANANFDPDATEIANAASQYRNGSPITVAMSSWTPPASLKSNGAEGCPGTKNCTLAMKDGAFDYAGFAAYWADAVTAYRKIGMNPQWVSIQNEPDWIADYNSCRFDPSESVVGGIRYAGYDQALNAVASRFAQWDSPPQLIGPEVLGIGYNDVQNYMAKLDASKLGALAHHLYHGGSETAPDTFDPALASLRTGYNSLPRFQTEYGRGDGFDTIWIMHNSMVSEEASAYLYWGAIWPDKANLVYIDFPWDRSKWTTDRGWAPNSQYYAMEHFSRFVQPGFVRYTALTNRPELRVSAYSNAQTGRTVIVAINTSTTSTVSPVLSLGGLDGMTATVYRTAFADLSERFASAGTLDASNSFSMPAKSAVTIVLDPIPPAN